MNTKYMTVKEKAESLGLHPQSVRRLCREGKLVEHHRTPGNHRRFDLPKNEEGETYVRVSSADQKKDLDV